jgi:heptosyltransferase-2
VTRSAGKAAKGSLDKDAVRKATKALFIAQSGIGNLLLATPSMMVLSKKVPGIRIDVLVSGRGGDAFLKGAPWLGGGRCIVAKELQAMGKKEMDALEKGLKAEDYDIVIVTFPSNNLESAILASSIGAPARAGHRSPAKLRPDKLYNAVSKTIEGKHEVDLNVDLVRALGLVVGDGEVPDPRIELTVEERRRGRETLTSCSIDPDKDVLVGMHPGAHKDMPQKRWKGFGDVAWLMLENKVCTRILVFGGPDEKGLARDIEKATGELGEGCGVVSLAGSLSLRETAAVISLCKAFISNDSGLMHIAAAVGVPLVAIFGPTSYVRTAPRGKHVVLRKERDCMPCYVMPGDSIKCEAGDCLVDIAPEEVVKAVRELLMKGGDGAS